MKNFKTTITALITPFEGNDVDFDSLRRLVKQQLDSGVGGFVINGTTAESPTLEWAEVREIFTFVRQLVGSNLPLIVGSGSNCTKKTIEMSQDAEKLGADALLVVVPYYNKPPQRGMIGHFEAVASAVKIPVILYNVPSRTISALTLESIGKLANHKNIIGIKEASGNIELVKEIKATCGNEFLLLSGDDASYPEFLQAGGHGVISVASHVIPGAFVNLLKNHSESKSYKRYIRLINLLFAEANPIPVKKALQLMGIINSAKLRLPLCELDENLTRDLALELEQMELL
jgi:4-hydroxy-tetrahydrodipicolinate synthase